MKILKIVFRGMLFVLFITSGIISSYAQNKKKPNIIFIMSDDHTSQAFGVYGSRLAKLNPTPTIDRLAKEGMLFENAFCNNAICTPSRATIMTGQYSQTNGVLDLYGRLPVKKQYLAHEMKKLGYQTAVFGKWHLKQKPEAFDFYSVLPGQGKYHNPLLYSNYRGKEQEAKLHGQGLVRTKITNYKGHSSDVITDISLDWFKNHRDKEQPFFVMHHFKAPHDMFEFAERYKNYLEDTEIPEPASLYNNSNNGSIATRGINDFLKRVIGSSVSSRNIVRNMGKHMKIDKNIPEPEYTHLAYQEYLKRYLRCVKGVDDNVKRLFDYLEKENLMDNTIIIYTGDQGFMLGEHDYIDKRWMYEEAMRMPLLIRYPKMIKAGTRTNAIVNNADFAPTIIDLAGGETPKYMQGNSFEYILKNEGNEQKKWPQSTYYRYWMHMAHSHANPAHFGIRTKRYKLIFFYGTNFKTLKPKKLNKYQVPVWKDTPVGWEFYDLEKDSQEMNNLYGSTKHKNIIEGLKIELAAKRAELNEEDTNYPHIQKIIDAHWND